MTHQFSNRELLEDMGGLSTMLWSPVTDQLKSLSDVLGNKVVLLYFSAKWCGPCRRFTPILSQFYEKYKNSKQQLKDDNEDSQKKKNSNDDDDDDDDEEPQHEDFEIVFLSLDYFLYEYQSYTSSFSTTGDDNSGGSPMPWWCAPYNKRKVSQLANKYGRSTNVGIPHLVVIDTDGTVLLDDGVEQISHIMNNTDDDANISFDFWKNYRPKKQKHEKSFKTIADLLPTKYIIKDKKEVNDDDNDKPDYDYRKGYGDGKKDDDDDDDDDDETTAQNDHHQQRPMKELDNKYLMLYFGASWCPPCKTFTPMLNKAYLNLKKNRNDFELLYVSYDNSESEFCKFFNGMGFGALPYSNNDPKIEKAKKALAKRLSVNGLPSLVMLGPRNSSNNKKSSTASGGSSSSNDDGDNYCKKRRLSEGGGYVCYNNNDNDKNQNGTTNTSSNNDDQDTKHSNSKKDNEGDEDDDKKNSNGDDEKDKDKDKNKDINNHNNKNDNDRPIINTRLRCFFDQESNIDYISEFPYHLKNYGDLNNTIYGNVNIEDQKCILIFHESGNEEEQEQIQQCLKTVATSAYKGKEPMKFYWVFSDNDDDADEDDDGDNNATNSKNVCSTSISNDSGNGKGDRYSFSYSVREILRLGTPKKVKNKSFSEDDTEDDQGEKPIMVLLDIANGGVYYMCKDIKSSKDITVDYVLDFISKPGEKIQI